MALGAKQSEKLGEKLLDLANISVAALTIGSVLSERGFDLRFFFAGLFVYAVLTGAGISLIRRSD